MTGFGGFGTGFGQPGTYASGPADGNYPDSYTGNQGTGLPQFSHNAVVVAIIVIIALALLVFGVIGLRASGEVVI